MKIGKWELSSLRNRKKQTEEKRKQPQGPMGNHHVEHHSHCVSSRRRDGESGRENILRTIRCKLHKFDETHNEHKETHTSTYYS